MKHSHPCRFCKTPVECHGDLQRNHDGWPETVCYDYHIQAQPCLCEACARPECHVCGEPAVQTVDDHDDGSGYKGEVSYCAEHYGARR